MYSSIHLEDDQDFGPRPCSYREIHSTYVGEQEHQGKKYAEMSEAYVRVIAQ